MLLASAVSVVYLSIDTTSEGMIVERPAEEDFKRTET
jgi:hypothetical protein